jgi:D-aminopeptidase
MKVYISADIEGVCGVSSWNETEIENGEHERAAAEMQKEVLSACQGALDAGATEIWVKDSHDSGRNLWIDGLPKEVRLIRGWEMIADSMVAGIDESFDAAMCIGYHSGGGTDGNPLSHTMTNSGMFWTKLNGHIMTELEYHSYVCAKYGVPMVLVSGDKALCDGAPAIIKGIISVPTKEGVGDATINRSPEVVNDEIRQTVKEALLAKQVKPLPTNEKITLELCFRRHQDAKKAGSFPGAVQNGPFTVLYESSDLAAVLNAFYWMHA